MKHKVVSVLITIFCFVFSAKAQTYLPVAVNGHNMDAIAETAGNSQAQTTQSLDWSNHVMYSANFGAGAGFACGGIVNSGTIVNGARTYQLQAFNGNNTFYIASGTSQTINLVTPAQFSRISLLVFSTEGSSTINVTFNYTSGSTAMGAFNVPDWFFNPGAVYAGFGRCTRVTAGSTANGCTLDPRFYPLDFSLSCADQQKTLQSITINTTFGNQGAYVMAVSGVSFTQTNTINPIVHVNCNGGNNGSATAAITGTNSPFTYSWNTSPVQTTSTANNLSAGNYTCSVTDSKGCVTTATVTITAPPVLTLTLTPVNASCGLNNGSISAAASGGTPTYSFSVNGGTYNTPSNFSPLATGTYTISVKDTKGCITPANVTLTSTPAPTVTVNSATICAGSTATLNASGASTYTWSPSGSLSSANGASVTASPTLTTNYTITATDVNSCTTTAVSTVTVNNNPLAAANNTGPYCEGATITLNGSGGGTYSWSGPNGFSSSAASPAIASSTTTMGGVYTLTVSVGTCSSTATTTVVVNPLPVPVVGNTGPYCPGTAVQLNAAGGTSYSWSGPNAFSSALSNPSPGAASAALSGIYTVTVTASGCSATASTTVTVGSSLVPQANSNSPLCEGAALSFNCVNGVSWNWAGPNGFSSSLQNPSVAVTTPADAGTYTITVSDASGCTGSTTLTVVVNALPLVNASPVVICAGDTAFLSASGAVNYTWSAGTSPSTGSNVIAVPVSGTSYTVNGIDTNGCTASATLAVTVNSLPAVSVNSPAICPSASATLTANGALTYAWSAGTVPANGAVVSVSPASSTQYTVTGTDVNGCVATAVSTVTVSGQLVIDAGVNDTVCTGAAFSLTASGGVNTTFTWNPGNLNGATQNFTAASTTVYTVSGTDASGCTGTDTVVVTVPPAIVLGAGGFPASCNGVCDGQVVVLAAPNTGPFAIYQYLWNNGANTASVNTVCAGGFTVTVTDAAGCVATATASVTEPAALVANAANIADASCNGVCNGAVTINANGGSAPYNYAWTPAATGSAPTNLCAGNYSCVVSDNNGCSTTVAVAITEPLPLSVTINPVSTACIGQVVNLNSNPSGGNGGYVFTWTGGVTVPANTQNVSASPAVTTAYTVSVADANGCGPATASVSVSVAGPLTVVAGNDIVLCEGSSGNLNAVAGGGDGTYTYTWSGGTIPGTGNAVSATPAQTSTYAVTVTDGCGTPAASDNVMITVNPLPVLSISNSVNAGCAPLCVDFTANSNPASVNCNWTFTNNETANANCNPNVCFADAGNYGATLTVTDVNGCTNSFTNNNLLTVYPVPQADFSWTPETPDVLNPVVNFTDISTGATISDWHWSFGNSAGDTSVVQNPQFNFVDAGTYNVTLLVTSDNGCTDVVTHPVTIEPDFVLYVPNAFTPVASNGVNDVFLPKGVGIDTENFEMWIYDRWGNMIFYSNLFSNGWDGKTTGSSETVLEDVYVWKIKLRTYRGDKKSYVGHVTVVK